jgi:hypothetical protein
MAFHNIIRLSGRQRVGIGAAALLAIGAAGGASSVALTRPNIEMAPTVPTAVSRLSSSSGIVNVRGRVAAVYGNRFLVEDGTGRMLVDTGRHGVTVAAGAPVLVQGRFDDGQLKARFLVDQAGDIQEVGAPPPHGHGGPPPHPPGGPGAPPPPPHAGMDSAPPPPPVGAGDKAGGAPTPPVNSDAPPPPATAPQQR